MVSSDEYVFVRILNIRLPANIPRAYQRTRRWSHPNLSRHTRVYVSMRMFNRLRVPTIVEYDQLGV